VRARGVAAITALWLVVCGVLAMRHEASTAHVRDDAGGYVHARTLAGNHAGHDSDIHGQHNPDAETGDCALLTTFHQAASAHVAAPVLVATTASVTTADLARRATAPGATAVYRLAPKTSPPATV
jgi:hypothetical protein